ncbi:Serine-threonine protein kinase [Entamoeba marina]
MEKSSWLPDYVDDLSDNEIKILSFDSNTQYDYGPCVTRGEKQNRYRPGHWVKLYLPQFSPNDYMWVEVNYTSPDDPEKELISPDDINSFCYARGVLVNTNTTSLLQVPLDYTTDGTNYTYYIYIYEETYAVSSVSVRVYGQMGKGGDSFYIIDQGIADNLLETKSSVRVVFPMTTEGRICYPACLRGSLMKVIRFTVAYVGKYSIIVNTTEQNRLRYFQQFAKTDDGFNECVQFWVGQAYGSLSGQSSDGILVRIKGEDTLNERLFTLISAEQEIDIPVTFTAVCPEDCNSDLGYGACSTRDGKCICEDGYGGDDCHLLCWYNDEWHDGSNGDNRCYYGDQGCDSYCQCEDGYTLVGHYCISTACSENNLDDSSVVCEVGTEGCLPNCNCDSNYVSSSDKTCIPNLCGNGNIDEVYSIDGYVRTEECDGGVNCDQTCKCLIGFEQNKDDPLSCSEIQSYGVYIGIAGGLGGFILLFVCILPVIFIFCLRTKKFDADVVKQQQPTYHLSLSGSTASSPCQESKHDIDPLELDFGNRDLPTAVLDTRFERIEIKNRSNKKWMLIIVHVPNNPKFIFHFESQVTFLRPRAVKTITCYMTLHCTTKVKDMRLPYTVWINLFDNWETDDEDRLKRACNGITNRYHHYFIVKTDAASSTHIDLDELNMREEPIAEGAMGRVYIGCYRSVPVAIKQFRWENLTKEEVEELKENVVHECEIMGRLRNPFIASYMGSVTYIQQVSMVIQFFVLGSLGEYVRESATDYFKLPYKLKLKMLFDTARGMSFLHENRILHLDLKPDNLLVNSLYSDSACCVKITDFGTSRFTQKSNLDKGLGTPIYVAPEAYNDVYSFESDVYSFGITAWEIFYQQEPYQDFKSLFEIKDFVEEGKRLTLEEPIPELLASMIDDCWKQNPVERPSFEVITKTLVKLVNTADNYTSLDDGVSNEKLVDFVEKRNERMSALTDDF